ncbi:type I restriction-modification system endonuclease [Merismopedia glauca]|uniref:Type I restriction-modification system endonuclease n=1 Tax=Merismopedia glauca CCAP 1448/3 TaxID=1296344 RepID=A0A2T1C4M3_9CYAN|nr:type I restriction-modification system endonuclease [Merismopedia glauca]PSB03232.1 type I restriction-modification system endonuclease [Merismopedia glauca CCAP 1448/3]
MTIESANFQFLQLHDVQLVRLGALAERYFLDDPCTCSIKLRQFGELLAQLSAAKVGLFVSTDEAQVDLLRRLKVERVISQEVAELFHQIRTIGNKATHRYSGDRSEALTSLKMARQLGIWFHRSFSDRNFTPAPFVPPAKPADATAELTQELARLQQVLAESRTEAEKAKQAAAKREKAALNAEEKAAKEAEERALWEQLAQESERARFALAAQLAELQADSQRLPERETVKIIDLADRAASFIDLDEYETRSLIDRQLQEAGWLADSRNLRYGLGTRPIKGQNMAIAEWKTADGIADYALFVGMRCVATIEAKRRRKNVSAAIDQAERYAKGFRAAKGFEAGNWGEFWVPFVFATNGRSYLKQLETESGIWFRDVRKATNRRRALTGWVTPEGLIAQLGMDADAANEFLKQQPCRFGFSLRPYQEKAIAKIEENIAADCREMLVAMATGTGKTKLAIALLYRLLAAKRFRRICFVVDRSALGIQSMGEFRTTKVVGAKAFGDIFGLQGLEDIVPESETKVHICTIQGLVKRILYAKEPGSVPPVDRYDLLLIDECHRGYLLDREMSDSELSFRSQDDYVSKYRRVLEHFDAVKIGLTATPALHTVQIFGEPIYTYSYREAVVDGFLIDCEPPVQITTALSQGGIEFASGSEMEVLNAATGAIDLVHAPDDLRFDVEDFNKKVITVAFNAAVARELAKHIDPSLPGKTLIFAANDAHADIVVEEVKQAMGDYYGEIEDAAVRKITGSVDRPSDLIRSYRNDAMPKIAVTVDLLTTGIDVPSITNLVFLRRVNSRILYEQMLGRATRRCDEIGKETFRIFDAVDLYGKLQHLTDMKPIVVNPKISLEQLFDEFVQVREDSHRQEIRDQILVKLGRQMKQMAERAREMYKSEVGEPPEATWERFKTGSLPELTGWVREKSGIGRILDWNPEAGGGTILPISYHADEVIAVTRGYGTGQKPDDFLEDFNTYIRDNVNQLAALTVVLQRPRELTRAQLRELRLELDKMGYSEANLRQAWQDAKNEDIAASIVGFIRQAALGDPLIPYGERVKAAMKRILSRQAWSAPQRKWLQRIGEQVAREFIVDREAIDKEPFQADGGFKRLDRIFDGQLEAILGDINEELWQEKA